MNKEIEDKIKEIEALEAEMKIKSIKNVEKLLEIQNNILFYRSLKRQIV
ncbi:MAG: hypothetical protein NTW30_05565 [Candidatus Aenigmarchaeota archaeon]|nr:hypothetical protein [Candidatus Aenigmarchaeota archaeon]